MDDSHGKTLFGLSPARYGTVSLVSALLAWCSLPLVVVVGLFLELCLLVPLLIVAVACGLVAVGAGIYRKDTWAIATGAAGLALIGLGAWAVSNSMNF